MQFNWSLLTRESLFSMLYAARKSIVNQPLTVTDLHSRLRYHIKQKLPVSIKSATESSQTPGLIYIGGFYFADIDQNKKKRHIQIVFSYHPDDTTLTLTNYRWARLCRLFADTVLHELTHVQQYRARNFVQIDGYESTHQSLSQRREQNYYGHKDEIGAFGYNIACELYDRFGNDETSIQLYLDSNDAQRRRNTSYAKYLQAFDFEHDHVVIKHLKRTIIELLPYAVTGTLRLNQHYLTY